MDNRDIFIIENKIEAINNKLFNENDGLENKLDALDEKLFNQHYGLENKFDALDEKLFNENDGLENKLDALDEKLFNQNYGLENKLDALDEKLFNQHYGLENKLDALDEKLFNENDGLENKLDALDEKLFNQHYGLENKLDTLDEKLFNQHYGLENKLDALDEKLFNENDGVEIIADKFTSNLNTTNEKIESFYNQSKEKFEEIENYFKKIEADTDEKIKKYDQIYQSFNTKIEALLPSALSAGLASSYKLAKDSFNQKIKTYSRILGCLYCVLACFGFYNLYQYSKIENITLVYALSKIVIQLPLLGLLAWITAFVSSKLNESIRLQQEYAHKESIASSYGSFKKQIESLKSDNEKDMLEKLMTDLITNVSFNPSSTLDKYPHQKSPFSVLGENIEKIKELLTSKK